MAATPPARSDGFAPIADYAVLGDGRTTALIASDGRIDWWPFPTLNAPPICAAILDPDVGGHFALTPQGPYQVSRRYLEGTNVVETKYTTPTGEARVTVALNTGPAGRLPWTELAQRVEGITGTVAMAWEFAPGGRFGHARPWVTHRHHTPFVTVGDQTLAVIIGGADPATITPYNTTSYMVGGTFRTETGRRVLVAVVGVDGEPLFIPSPDEIDARVDHTVESWRRWTAQLQLTGPWAPAVERSALALKTLVAEATGAIAAAATTSLPEKIGGPKNWDYRYSWVRDSSFTVDALINLGLHAEVQGAVTWLLDALRRNGPDLHIFYTLEGSMADEQTELNVPGYRHSRPVRAGNTASGQSQLGTYGDLFDTIWRYTSQGHILDPATGRLLAGLADRCCDQWATVDSGIWELGQLEHYTISKMGCWVALDRATKLAAAGQIPSDRADRWSAEADTIRQWVNTHCWSETKQSYTLYAGTDDLDAAVLLAGRTGFERGPRLTTTIEAVTAELAAGPLLYRYTGMADKEGAFVACSFWLVDALAHTGQADRARTLMNQTVAHTNNLGLLSEQIDPATGEFLGNTPQGLSHLSLINAAHTLQHTTNP